MKLIIDIPESTLIMLKESGVDWLDAEYILSAVAQGIPLDDVKAEIEKQIERDFAFAEAETLKVPCHYGIANGLQNAIRFLDNIGKESEDKE